MGEGVDVFGFAVFVERELSVFRDFGSSAAGFVL